MSEPENHVLTTTSVLPYRTAATRRWHEASIDACQRAGLVVLAVFDTCDVVARAAGRLLDQGLRDVALRTSELVHDLTQTAAHTLVELADTAVDTSDTVGDRLVREATTLSRHAQALLAVGGDALKHSVDGGRRLFATVPRPTESVPTIIPVVVH